MIYVIVGLVVIAALYVLAGGLVRSADRPYPKPPARVPPPRPLPHVCDCAGCVVDEWRRS